MADNKQVDNNKNQEKEKNAVNKKAPVANGYSVPERIWNYLTQEKGLSSVATAAIMGNIFAESTYNPNAYNDSELKAGRARNAAIGICQWLNGRHDNLAALAKQKGKEWNDLEVQLEYLWKEASGNSEYKAGLDYISKCSEAQLEDAVIKWEKVFERSGDEASYPKRIQAAKEALAKQGKGIIAAGTYVPGTAPANGFVGQTSAAKRGTVIESVDVETTGHRDEYIVKPLDPDKTFCEPIYPDLTSVGEEVPPYSMPSNVPTSDMKLLDYEKAGAGLVYELPTSSIVKYSSDTNLSNYIVLNEEIANQRKEVFDAAVHRNIRKIMNPGKPPNNMDPFPVDAKIVELETHQPRCKIESVQACKHSLEAAKAVVLLSTDTEKRLVRLENNMATIMRYLYRLAGRVHINCVYYGGQSIYERYKCIRCLQDDRVHEGIEVSMDQCLNCTRYEPLIGQVYDIFNDAGLSLSAILDDNQMSYTTMDEYCKFRRKVERQTPMEEAKTLDAAGVNNRNTAEMDLNDMWGPGLAMDWSLYPVELQQPHVTGEYDPLASGYGANSGAALTNGGAIANMLIEARNQIDASDSNAKQTGSNYAATKTDSLVSEMKAKLGSQIRETYQSKKISSGQDQCLIASLMSVYGGQVGDTIDKLETAKTALKGKGVDNIVLHVMFYALDHKYLLGDENKDKLPMRLDEVKKKTEANSSDVETPDEVTVMPAGAWNNVSRWNWNDICQALAINITGKDDTKSLPDQMLNFAKVVYLYKELLAKCSASRFDTADWGFPFTEEQIASAEIGLNHPVNGEFGNARPGHMHNGVDIGVFGGADRKSNGGSESQLMRQPVHAARDGIVSWLIPNSDPSGGGGGNCMGIQHDNGYSSCYMHLSSFAVQQNQKVSRGEVIGYTGGSGGSTLIDYDEHLHFEIRPDGSRTGIDPWSVYNGNLSAQPRPFQFRNINP